MLAALVPCEGGALNPLPNGKSPPYADDTARATERLQHGPPAALQHHCTGLHLLAASHENKADPLIT